MVQALGVPFLGSPAELAGVVALLVLASLGLGLFISVISDSERQAVQLSLLLLLASVFFSGFVISIDQFQPIVRDAAYLLPVTHGIQLIQDVLLRGSTTAIWQIWALGGDRRRAVPRDLGAAAAITQPRPETARRHRPDRPAQTKRGSAFSGSTPSSRIAFAALRVG